MGKLFKISQKTLNLPAGYYPLCPQCQTYLAATTPAGLDGVGREINIDRIHDLEKQVGEGAGDIVKLKRARNSLLNISTIVPPRVVTGLRIPPEILGFVFHWNVIPDVSLPLGSIAEWHLQFLPRLSPFVRGCPPHPGSSKFLG